MSREFTQRGLTYSVYEAFVSYAADSATTDGHGRQRGPTILDRIVYFDGARAVVAVETADNVYFIWVSLFILVCEARSCAEGGANTLMSDYLRKRSRRRRFARGSWGTSKSIGF